MNLIKFYWYLFLSSFEIDFLIFVHWISGLNREEKEKKMLKIAEEGILKENK